MLRGELPEGFLDGPHRYSVCELCKPRALHEGWVREGTIPDFQGAGGPQARRRSLLGRFRGRGAPVLEERSNGHGRSAVDGGQSVSPRTLDDELSAAEWPPAELDRPSLPVRAPAPEVPPTTERRRRPREPRHVHAVPTGDQEKIAAALNAFNRTEYTRTVASVSRSLGGASINVTPDPDRPTLVRVVATWELCWYRYEVDLGDESGGVRLDAQGYELTELSDQELEQNALADDTGRLYYE